MIQFTPEKSEKPLTFLFLGAHCDDIEIGCGGTILSIVQAFPDLKANWIVFSSNPVRANEAQKSASLFLSGIRDKNVAINNFRNGYFPYVGAEIKDYFEQLKTEIPRPDIIFTHLRDDLHQDHRIISQLTWNTYRNHCILEYEIPKYDGDLKQPNFFIPITESICNNKIHYLMKCFHSQSNKHWFTEDTIRSLCRLRGIESNSPTSFAEGFYCRKLICKLLITQNSSEQ